MKKIEGWEAIELKKGNPSTRIDKYADPINDYMEDISLDFAEDVAREDPGLIFVYEEEAHER